MKKFCITLLLSSINFLIHSNECYMESMQKHIENPDEKTYLKNIGNMTAGECSDKLKKCACFKLQDPSGPPLSMSSPGTCYEVPQIFCGCPTYDFDAIDLKPGESCNRAFCKGRGYDDVSKNKLFPNKCCCAKWN